MKKLFIFLMALILIGCSHYTMEDWEKDNPHEKYIDGMNSTICINNMEYLKNKGTWNVTFTQIMDKNSNPKQCAY